MMTADEITAKMTLEVIDDLPFKAGDEVAVLINGLGGYPSLNYTLAIARSDRYWMKERSMSGPPMWVSFSPVLKWRAFQ